MGPMGNPSKVPTLILSPEFRSLQAQNCKPQGLGPKA